MSKIKSVLVDSWNYYKNNLIDKDGRPLAVEDTFDLDMDKDKKERVSFSESVSYVLPRALLMDDRATFDKTWKWAQKNMQHKNLKALYYPISFSWLTFPEKLKDNLFAWRYFPGVESASGAVLKTDACDHNPASDADQDIAAALILASRKWSVPAYLEDAKLILKDIWNKETTVIDGKRVLLINTSKDYGRNIETGGKSTYPINPSYFRPTYYKYLFAEVDPSHDWKSLVEPSYEIIEKSSDATMHNWEDKKVEGKVNLPPDEAAITQNGEVTDLAFGKGDNADKRDFYFAGDAFRTLYWMTVQATIDPKDPKAQKYLKDETGTKEDFGPRAFLKKEFAKNQGEIYAYYNLDGSVHYAQETPQSLAAYLSFFNAAGDKKEADALYDKIMKEYNPAGYWSDNPKEYYAQNWIWFNLYLVAYGPKILPGISSK